MSTSFNKYTLANLNYDKEFKKVIFFVITVSLEKHILTLFAMQMN